MDPNFQGLKKVILRYDLRPTQSKQGTGATAATFLINQ